MILSQNYTLGMGNDFPVEIFINIDFLAKNFISRIQELRMKTKKKLFDVRCLSSFILYIRPRRVAWHTNKKTQNLQKVKQQVTDLIFIV